MEKSVHVQHQGKTYEGSLIPVEESVERWTIINLEDGTVIRMKPVVTDVVRLLGEFDHDGQPVYVVKTANVMSVQVPNQLLRSPEDVSEGIQ